MNLTVKCPSCGGVVVLNPKTRQLQCTQCDSVISRGIGEENSAMVRNEDGELVDKRSYKAIQKIARIKRYILMPRIRYTHWMRSILERMMNHQGIWI